MLPIRNISYLLPMCCSFWEKCINSQKTGLGCSTPLRKKEWKGRKGKNGKEKRNIFNSDESIVSIHCGEYCTGLNPGAGWVGLPPPKKEERKKRKRKRSDVLCLCAIMVKLTENGDRMCTVTNTGSGWGPHIKANGDVLLSWVAFLREILKHGSCFLQTNPWTWVQFSDWAQIFGFFAWQKPRKLHNLWKKDLLKKKKKKTLIIGRPTIFYQSDR